MTQRPDDIPGELYEAARVSRIMAADETDHWRLKHFTVSEEHYQTNMLRHQFVTDPARAQREMAREVPPGDYVSLHRRMTEVEVEAWLDEHANDIFFRASVGECPREEVVQDVLAQFCTGWVPVMSDTPAEIREFAPALARATGRVLITGLGLGCLPHALLLKPDVTHIDIVEIDPEVIALTGHYLTGDPRVHIHHASALDIDLLFAPGSFDYAWHDIWSGISEDNLADETAEHGISYDRLFDLTIPLMASEDADGGYVAVIEAWAYDLAREMKAVLDRERKEELEFQAALRSMTADDAVEAIIDRLIRDHLHGRVPEGGITPGFREHILSAIDPSGTLRGWLRERLADPDFWDEFERHKAERERPARVSMPNARLA